MILNYAKLIKLGNDSEVLFMKLDGVIVYQKGLHLYIPYEYKSRNDIIEVKTAVRKIHTDLSFMFYFNTRLKTVYSAEWDTSNVTLMNNMFTGCEELTTLDTSNWDTGKVTDMRAMFSSCVNLTTLDVSNWDTDNVTDMRGMFYRCEELTTLDASNWDTSKVTDMNNMFCLCLKLTSLDLSGWNTRNVTNMLGVFDSCKNLQKLNLSNWNMISVKTAEFIDGTVYNYTSSMFGSCDSLHTLRLDNCGFTTIKRIIESPGFPTGTINGVTRKIYCKEFSVTGLTAPEGWEFVYITPYEVGKFTNNTEITEVTTIVDNTCTDLSYMFQNCQALTTINGIEEWDTSSVTTMESMFNNCNALTSLNLSSLDTSNVTTMRGMFYNCSYLTSLDLSSFDMSKVTSTLVMFDDCLSLHILRLDNCSTDTINKIITSLNFPTNAITDVTRKIYVNRDNVADLTAPTNWVFVDCETNEVIE